MKVPKAPLECRVMADAKDGIKCGNMSGRNLIISPRSPPMDSPSRKEPTQGNLQPQEPLLVRIDPKWCAQSVRLP